MRQPVVYIMANRYRGSMYVGVSSDLPKRISEHKLEITGGYTAERGIKRLV